MQFAAGPPSKWLVFLRGNGEVIEVWADSVSEEDGYFVFSILVDATPEEQADVDVTGRTPTNPKRVIMTVARFPAATIDDPRSA